MRTRTDVVRQAVTLTAAIAQTALPVLLMPSFDRDKQPPDVMQPADWTFAVWGPIFATSIVHGLDQARPSRSDDAALRATGWSLAAGYACTAVWAPLVATRRYWAAQSALIGLAILSEVSRRRVAAAAEAGQLAASDRLVLVPGSSMLAAWGSAAATVNLAAMLVGERVVPVGAPATALGTAATGAAGGLLALLSAATPGGRSSLSARVHTATSVWGLVGIALGQRTRSRPVALAAAAAAVTVAVAPVGHPLGPWGVRAWAREHMRLSRSGTLLMGR